MASNVFNYIEKYKNYTFQEMKMNDIDMLIFSQLSYLNLTEVFKTQNDYKSIREIINILQETDYSPVGIAAVDTYKIIKAMNNTVRYSNIKIGNYIYKNEDELQFGVLTIKFDNNIIISFEGTDNTLNGWKEDFLLSYTYPTKGQILAKDYLSKIIKFDFNNYYVVGHSKGGNLALTSSMEQPYLKRLKIKRIYSFDGPGLKESEFYSKKYENIKNKLVNIIPNFSIVGVLLKQENVKVIKSNGLGIYQHEATTWQIKDNDFVYTEQMMLSKSLDEAINVWLKKYDVTDRKKIVDEVFKLFFDNGIQTVNDIKQNKLKLISIIVKSSLKIDDETRYIVLCIIKLLQQFRNETIKNGKIEIKNKINNTFKKQVE